MASWLGKPLVLVNADARLLLSNKALLPVADRVCFGFDGGSQGVKQARVTGNPVRAAIEQLPPPKRCASRVAAGPCACWCVGGSLGAKVLNETLPAALALMPPEQRPQLIHQTGQAHLEAVHADYARRGLDADLRPFIADMAAEFAQADLVICRAGAITVSELCAAGSASVLVPLVVSTTAHQRDNAEYMERASAAIHLPQARLTPESLADLLGRTSRNDCLRLAVEARSLARPQAAARVADAIEELLK
jgi:UDP-N-acetylglucosamine--N-acetylmuramyl-(pentapeptide) pyrophosphoryl-undecaprenol N-acetylglucosamine transferase